MSPADHGNPFHAGERAAQARACVGDLAAWAGSFIRDHLPEQHRAFHISLPFLVVSGGDAAGRTWITLIEGPDGFVTSPDPRHIHLASQAGTDDPLAAAFAQGTDIGGLGRGIELASRRRNRFSGHIRPSAAGYAIDIRQTFGNCPQYVSERAWRRVETTPGRVIMSTALSADQIAQITAADTMFIGSGHRGRADAASDGYDASHRGGVAGFVQVVDDTHMRIPDYAGNNFFNTIGNLMADPRVGLLFIDFETGGLLHLTGRATIDWNPGDDHDARRMIDARIDQIIQRPAAVSLRWARQDHLTRRLRLDKRVRETADVVWFHFAAADGRPLDPFAAGQHLPIELQIPGQKGTSRRSYSLSGSPDDRHRYRISIKREDKGLVSRFLHDHLAEGSLIDVQRPSGDFVIPCSNCPLVLVGAGVGFTPMLTMLHATRHHDRRVWYVHGTSNGDHHAMRHEVDASMARPPRHATCRLIAIPAGLRCAERLALLWAHHGGRPAGAGRGIAGALSAVRTCKLSGRHPQRAEGRRCPAPDDPFRDIRSGGVIAPVRLRFDCRR